MAEKGFITAQLSVHTSAGHSSMPPRESSIGIMSNAVAKWVLAFKLGFSVDCVVLSFVQLTSHFINTRCIAIFSSTAWASHPVSQLLSQLVSQPFIQSVSQPASQSVSRSVSQPASQSVSQSVSQPAIHSVSQPVSKSVSQLVSQSVIHSVSHPASQSVGWSVSHSFSQSAS